MKQEVYRWHDASFMLCDGKVKAPVFYLVLSGREVGLHTAAGGAYPYSATVWVEKVGGFMLSYYREDVGDIQQAKLLASREIQRQLREKGVECIIRDGKTGEIL